MSKKPRCKTCLHRRGPRSVAPIAKAETKGKKPHGEQPKKASCSCKCHIRGS